MLAVNDRGVIAGGSLAGSTIRAVLETAAREGWLAYRVRPDGWYSAAWWPERKCIALCGPVQPPKAVVIEPLQLRAA